MFHEYNFTIINVATETDYEQVNNKLMFLG
jgi:hypothetical protein